MTLMMSSSASRESMPTTRGSSPAPPSASACSILPVSRSSVASFSSCSALRQSEASFGPDAGFSPSNLNRAGPLAASIVWSVSPAEPPQPSDLPSLPASKRRFSLGSASMAQTINTDDGAMISDLASASSASWTDHFVCATALRLRRAVQPLTRDGDGISACLTGRSYRRSWRQGNASGKASDAECERSDFT
ncbi:hypothetical protein ACVIIV_003318 [Bradyrhizobium sp. USDA 4354]